MCIPRIQLEIARKQEINVDYFIQFIIIEVHYVKTST